MGRFIRTRFRAACGACCALIRSWCPSTTGKRIHNCADMSTRGEHLLHADRRFATGGGMLARLTAPAFAKLLDEIDRRLAVGGIEVIRPDGSKRRLGFREDGPVAIVRFNSWLA